MRNESSKTITKLLLAGCLLLLAGNLAAAAKPLIMEGKKTLYQRVLSIPAARLYQAPADSPESSPIVPFSVLYVYDRENDWIKVGYDSFGKTAGWVKSDKAITWNQALTVSFKDPQDTQRVMMFNSKDALQKLVDDYDMEGYQKLYNAVISGDNPKDSPVIAIQPEAHLEIRDNFYLVPSSSMKMCIWATNRRVCWKLPASRWPIQMQLPNWRAPARVVAVIVAVSTSLSMLPSPWDPTSIAPARLWKGFIRR